MKIFIDSAEIKEIEAAAATGLIDGVTTNPSLVAKSGVKFEDLLRRICELVNGPISAEVTAMDAPGMIREGQVLAKIHRNIVVKVPLTTEGLKATRAFSGDGIKTNVTLCFTAVQAWMAAKAGATYISPFVGRLDDIGEKGMDLIADIKKVYDNYGYQTQILVASIRHVEHVLESVRIGAHVGTMPYKVFSLLLNHPLTEKGLAQFLKDWESAKK
jgi:transaldolase